MSKEIPSGDYVLGDGSPYAEVTKDFIRLTDEEIKEISILKTNVFNLVLYDFAITLMDELERKNG